MENTLKFPCFYNEMLLCIRGKLSTRRDYMRQAGITAYIPPCSSPLWFASIEVAYNSISKEYKYSIAQPIGAPDSNSVQIPPKWGSYMNGTTEADTWKSIWYNSLTSHSSLTVAANGGRFNPISMSKGELKLYISVNNLQVAGGAFYRDDLTFDYMRLPEGFTPVDYAQADRVYWCFTECIFRPGAFNHVSFKTIDRIEATPCAVMIHGMEFGVDPAVKPINFSMPEKEFYTRHQLLPKSFEKNIPHVVTRRAENLEKLKQATVCYHPNARMTSCGIGPACETFKYCPDCKQEVR